MPRLVTPGCDHDAAVVEVDLEDAVELAHAEQHAVGERQRAARQRGAGAARHDADAVLVAIAQDCATPARWSPAAPRPAAAGDRRSARRSRKARISRSCVDHALARHDAAQVGDDLGAPRQHGLIRLGHCQRHRRPSRFSYRQPRNGCIGLRADAPHSRALTAGRPGCRHSKGNARMNGDRPSGLSVQQERG